MYKYFIYRHVREDKRLVFYIGVGTKPKRFTTHKSEFIRAYMTVNSGRGEIWNRIVNKTDYRIEIMFESNDYNLILRKEVEFIRLYGRINNNSGTLANMTDGGRGVVGFVHREESKVKMSLAHKGKRIEASVVARIVSTRRESGYSHSIETRKKMSLAAMNNNNGASRTFIVDLRCYNLRNKLIMKFSSVRQAATYFQISVGAIYHNLLKQTKYCHVKIDNNLIKVKWKIIKK